MSETSASLAPEASPVLILASRESGGTLLSAMLGQHPDFHGAPHLNLLAFETPWQLQKYSAIPRDSNVHGLLRYIGERLTGEDSVQSVQAAQRWLGKRAKHSSADTHAELRTLAAPKRLVDYSPLVGQNDATISRAVAALPATAKIIHLTRNPFEQGRAMSLPVWQTVMSSLEYWDRRGRVQPCMDAFEVGEQLIDWSVQPPVFDPQFAWHRTQIAAVECLDALEPDRWTRVDSDLLARKPQETLTAIFAFLGVQVSAREITEICASGVPDIAIPGPYTAPFGMDYEMLGCPISEAIARGAKAPTWGEAGAPLPWRGDGETLLPEVVDLAKTLGYRLAF